MSGTVTTLASYIDGLSGERGHYARAYWNWVFVAARNGEPPSDHGVYGAKMIRIVLHAFETHIRTTGERRNGRLG